MTARDAEMLPDYLRIPLGQVVHAWRVAQGLTLEDLAAKAGAGFTRGYLSQLENDRIHTPSEGKLAQLATALGIDPLLLVTRQFPDESVPGAPRGGAVQERPSDEHLTVDVSPLLSALGTVPPGRQQQYVDALVSLVRHLSAGEQDESRESTASG